jgi:hypothetical protein
VNFQILDLKMVERTRSTRGKTPEKWYSKQEACYLAICGVYGHVVSPIPISTGHDTRHLDSLRFDIRQLISFCNHRICRPLVKSTSTSRMYWKRAIMAKIESLSVTLRRSTMLLTSIQTELVRYITPITTFWI